MKQVPTLLLVPRQLSLRRYTTPVPPHLHRMWELSIFESGEFKNIIDDQEYLVSAGEVFLIGEPHSHTLNFRSGPNSYWDLYIPDDLLHKICDMISYDLYEQIRSKQLLVHFKLSSRRLQNILHDLRELSNYDLIASTIESPSDNKQLFPSTFLIHYLLGIYSNRRKMEKSPLPDWFQNLLYNLQSPEFFSKPVADIISSTGYSPAQFSRVFKSQIGITLVEYLQSKRMDYALELLQKTDYSIIKISLEVGYTSLSFFIKTFKKLYGVTPLQYRINFQKSFLPQNNN